jgi:hypothetical protein
MTLPKLIPTEGSVGGAAALPADQDVYTNYSVCQLLNAFR